MKQIINALFFAGLILSIALWIPFAEKFGLPGANSERQAGATMGIILIWFGNYLPKQPSLNSSKNNCVSCNSKQSFSMRRFAGTMLMLGGTIQTIAWLFAPLEQANVIAMAGVASSLVLILLRAFVTRTFV